MYSVTDLSTITRSEIEVHRVVELELEQPITILKCPEEITITINKWSKSNLTKGRIATAHGRLSRIRQVAPNVHPIYTKPKNGCHGNVAYLSCSVSDYSLGSVYRKT